jgi:hypothetical protein
MRATQPSTPASNVRQAGPQGTPGGKARKPGVAGRRMIVGQEIYLWILVLIEVALIGGFRKYFRRFHGG